MAKTISKTTKNLKKNSVSEVIEKKNPNNLEGNVSIFTKTTNPKVIIQSENVNNHSQSICRHRLLKSIYLIILGIIVLMTFFLSLKTYNIVNELYLLLPN